MSRRLERRYRGVLRLLPEGYRRVWEEDMVAAFLDSTEHADRTRLTLGERLSVVSLAVRLRLSGSHVSPSWALWYRVVYGMALVVLLYQSVAATAKAIYRFAYYHELSLDPGPWYAPLLLIDFVGLLWVPAFALLVLRRIVAAQVFAFTAALASVGVTVAISLMYSNATEPAFGLGDVSRWGWLAVSAAVVFVIPADAKASPWLWSGAYLLGSAVVTAYYLRTLGSPLYEAWPWLKLGDITTIGMFGLIAALTVGIARAAIGRSASPHWLLACGLVSLGIGGIKLARWSNQVLPPFETPAPATPVTYIAMVMVGLSLLGLVVGTIGWRRSIAATGQP